MAYDEALVARIRDLLGPRRDISERKMFGGVAFLVDGKMFCGITNADLMVRVGPEGYRAALARPHARPMDFTGRPLTGYVYVAKQGTATTRALRAWVTAALAFTSTVKAKPRRKPRPRPRPARAQGGASRAGARRR